MISGGGCVGVKDEGVGDWEKGFVGLGLPRLNVRARRKKSGSRATFDSITHCL